MTRTDTANFQMPNRLLRVQDVAELVGLAKPTIYKRLAAGDFPRPIKVSPGASRWPLGEVLAWIDSRPRSDGDGIRRAS